MFIKLLLVFTIVPIIELSLLIEVGERIGTFNTIALIFVTGIIGASYAKSQGAQIIYKIRSSVNQAQIPGRELVQGAMIIAGGILLITPGFITDLVGFSLLIPYTREYYVKLASAYIKKKFDTGQWQAKRYSNYEKPHINEENDEKQRDE